MQCNAMQCNAMQCSAMHCRYLLRRSQPARPPFVRRAADEYLLAAGRLRACIPRARCRRESRRGGIARAVVAWRALLSAVRRERCRCSTRTCGRCGRRCIGEAPARTCRAFVSRKRVLPRGAARTAARVAWRGIAYPSRPSPPGVLAGTAGACCATKSFACGRSRRMQPCNPQPCNAPCVPLQHAPCGHATCRPRHAASDVHNATCGVRRAQCGARRPTCTMRRAQCDVHNATCGATLQSGADAQEVHAEVYTKAATAGVLPHFPAAASAYGPRAPARARVCPLALPPNRQLLHAPAAASARRARTPAPRESIDSACARSCTGTTR